MRKETVIFVSLGKYLGLNGEIKSSQAWLDWGRVNKVEITFS